MARTEVGLKCQACAQPAPASLAVRAPSRRVPLVLAVAGLAAVVAAGLVFTLISSSPADPVRPPAPPVGAWSELPDLATVRGTAAAVVLADGRVLVAGGGVGSIALGGAEVLDQASGRWAAVASLTRPRRGHRGVVLDDGRVLIAGGIAEGELLASVEVYDPAKGTWAAVAPMSTPRLGHSLSLLGDGRVLAAGGTVPGGEGAAASAQTIRPAASTEVYDPVQGTWAPAASMGSGRFEHTATALPDGRVLMTGGLGPAGDRVGPLATSELYDPPANAFVRSTDLKEPRTNHAAAALDDGSILVVGGAGGVNGDISVGSTEVFDSRQGTWTVVGPLAESRAGHSVTALADGRVLVAGGESVARGARRSLASAEVFDTADRAWRSAGPMACSRSEHDAVRLGDGTVLVVAGDATFPGAAPIARSCVSRYRP